MIELRLIVDPEPGKYRRFTAVRRAYGRLCGLVGIGLNLLLFGGNAVRRDCRRLGGRDGRMRSTKPGRIAARRW